MKVIEAYCGFFLFFFLLQEFNSEPVIPVYSARPEQVGKALKHVYTAALKLKGKELELLLAILPDNNGSLYGTFFFYMYLGSHASAE